MYSHLQLILKLINYCDIIHKNFENSSQRTEHVHLEKQFILSSVTKMALSHRNGTYVDDNCRILSARHYFIHIYRKAIPTAPDFILGNLFSIKNYKKTYLNRSVQKRGRVVDVDSYLRHINNATGKRIIVLSKKYI